MDENKICRLNKRLFLMKLHYFLFYGAVGGVMSYLPVLSKDLGISATAVGVIYTVVPFCIFFSKPLFGYITDYFRNIKFIIFALACVTCLSYLSILLIQSIHDIEWNEVELQCINDQPWLYAVPIKYDKSCIEDALQVATNCKSRYSPCDKNSSHITLYGKTTIKSFEERNTSSFVDSSIRNTTTILRFEPDANFTCGCINTSFLMCPKPVVNSCFIPNNKTVFQTLQFWIFTLLVVVAGTAAETVFCLNDAACYEMLGDHPEHYGRQRLWGTISWGCATFLSGYLNDVITGNSDIRSYFAGFYLMFSLIIMDLILLLKIPLRKATFSADICKDISKIFSSCETIAFAIAVYIAGGLTGIIWSYLFWYLQDLGATQTLLGLVIAVQCLAAEVPFFFFSGWFIKNLGHFYCLIASFMAFALRFGLYYGLQNPWIGLPIEVLHGVTFAVFYASMTGYASEKAPPGTETTMMGILGSLFEGLGVATGSLLGGVGFDKIGGRHTFLVACFISSICVPIFAMTHIVIKRLSPKVKVRSVSDHDPDSE